MDKNQFAPSHPRFPEELLVDTWLVLVDTVTKTSI